MIKESRGDVAITEQVQERQRRADLFVKRLGLRPGRGHLLGEHCVVSERSEPRKEGDTVSLRMLWAPREVAVNHVLWVLGSGYFFPLVKFSTCLQRVWLLQVQRYCEKSMISRKVRFPFLWVWVGCSIAPACGPHCAFLSPAF